MSITTIGEAGKVQIRRKLRRSELIPFFEKQDVLQGRHRGMQRGASLGPPTDRSRTRREADRARGGQALREEGQEERRR